MQAKTHQCLPLSTPTCWRASTDRCRCSLPRCGFVVPAVTRSCNQAQCWDESSQAPLGLRSSGTGKGYLFKQLPGLASVWSVWSGTTLASPLFLMFVCSLGIDETSMRLRPKFQERSSFLCWKPGAFKNSSVDWQSDMKFLSLASVGGRG